MGAAADRATLAVREGAVAVDVPEDGAGGGDKVGVPADAAGGGTRQLRPERPAAGRRG